MLPLTTALQSYLFSPSPGTRAATYLLLVWLVSLTLFQEISTNFFSNIKNPLNQYFVKYAWGWTLFPLSFLLLMSSIFSKKGTMLNTKSVPIWLRLAVCTSVWFSLAQVVFPYIEESTGVCEVSRLLTKRDCRDEGFGWRGFDISGHCFLLTWNNLVIIEEMKMVKLYFGGSNSERHPLQDLVIKSIHLLICLLMILWEVMMFCTSLYFHTTLEKVLGTICAITPWLVLYRLMPMLYSLPMPRVSHTIPQYMSLSGTPGASWVLARLE